MIKVRHLRVCVCWCWLLCLFIVPLLFRLSPLFAFSPEFLSPSSPEAKAEQKQKSRLPHITMMGSLLTRALMWVIKNTHLTPTLTFHTNGMQRLWPNNKQQQFGSCFCVINVGLWMCRMALGYAYPAYKCYKSVEIPKPDTKQLEFWCQYWSLPLPIPLPLFYFIRFFIAIYYYAFITLSLSNLHYYLDFL